MEALPESVSKEARTHERAGVQIYGTDRFATSTAWQGWPRRGPFNTSVTDHSETGDRRTSVRFRTLERTRTSLLLASANFHTDCGGLSMVKMQEWSGSSSGSAGAVRPADTKAPPSATGAAPERKAGKWLTSPSLVQEVIAVFPRDLRKTREVRKMWLAQHPLLG
jgi:hypothetical protein